MYRTVTECAFWLFVTPVEDPHRLPARRFTRAQKLRQNYQDLQETKDVLGPGFLENNYENT